MHFKVFLVLFPLALSCFSQDTIPVSKIDTPINFFGLKPLRLYPYNNRVVPFDDVSPLYVQINYEDGKNKKLEYFRMDSTRYLVYEFFRSAKNSSIDGVKSRGVMRVSDEIAGMSTTSVRHIGGEDDKHTREIHFYKALIKEGRWEEYEDSVFHHIYWVGNYINNRRIGLWKHIVYGIGDDFVLEEIDYSKDSTQKIFSSNVIKTISIDSLKRLLVGRWHLRGCDEEKEPRMFYSKCETFDGAYGDDCNSSYGRSNHYDFTTLTSFVRQRGDGCYKFRENCRDGKWAVTERNGERYIEMKFTNGQTWKLKVLYLD